jgi:hypothetical protein
VPVPLSYVWSSTLRVPSSFFEIPLFDTCKKQSQQLGMVVHACNPSYLGGRGRRTTTF